MADDKAEVDRVLEVVWPQCTAILRDAIDKIWTELGPDSEWERQGKDDLIDLVLLREIFLRRAIRRCRSAESTSDIDWIQQELIDWNDDMAAHEEAAE